MYKISMLNKISPKGLERFDSKYELGVSPEDAAGILVRSQDMNSMEFSGNLLAIARAGAGVNNIPLKQCSERGIVVFNTPGANANAVKELALTGILMSARNLSSAISWTQTLTSDSDVARTVEKNKSKFAGEEIKGKTLGVIGLGSIGTLVANSAELLGMKVLGYDPYISVKSAHELSPTVRIFDTLDPILPACDYITIHVPFMETTKEMFNKKRFELMNDGTVLLNFSRDKIVKDADIISAIESGRIRKYVTDFPTDAILGLDHVYCFPHLGASTKESEDNCAVMAADQLKDYLENGNITNSVNYPKCSMGTPTTMARICLHHRNIPAMIGKITGILAEKSVNIRDMLNRSTDEYAYTMLDVDTCVDENELRSALNEEGIIALRVIYTPELCDIAQSA